MHAKEAAEIARKAVVKEALKPVFALIRTEAEKGRYSRQFKATEMNDTMAEALKELGYGLTRPALSVCMTGIDISYEVRW